VKQQSTRISHAFKINYLTPKLEPIIGQYADSKDFLSFQQKDGVEEMKIGNFDDQFFPPYVACKATIN
jgi:hypothetical protein